MKVCVVGLGYIGLPTTLMMASHGVDVVGVDVDPSLVDTLNHGHVTFSEDGLFEAYQEACRHNVQFTTTYPVADMYVIAVATPYDSFSKRIDASYVVGAMENVMDVCKKGAIVCIESTVSPGTIDRFVRPVITRRGLVIGEDIHLAHAPERIIPGNMLYELVHNSRTFGVDEPEIGRVISEVYRTFCKGDMVVTSIRVAEMTKVVENTFRDINIAYANELTKICHQDGMDVYEVIRIANMHPRVNILNPGPGVGGHCISVDPWFLVGDYPSLALLIKQARTINDSMPDYVLNRVHEIMKEKGMTDVSRVGFYGLTYKEDVDDTRESPTLQLLESMERHLACGAKVYDPCVERDVVPNQYHDIDAFLRDVDMVVIMVGHSALRNNLSVLDGKVVLDTRHICGDRDVYRL